MRHELSSSSLHGLRIRLLVLGSALAALLFALPAAAHPRHDRYDRHDRKHSVHRYDKRYDRHYRQHRRLGHYEHGHRGHFVVPKRIRNRRHLRELRAYYHGRFHDRRHGHYHTVYRFPVLTRYGWTYQPHTYCGGELYVDDYRRYDRGYVSFGIRF